MRENFPIRYEFLREKLIERNCVGEINFSIVGDEIYDDCWMGCFPDGDTPYWFGLTPDGKQAYDYATADELLNAKVFNGKSFFELWDKVQFYTLDAISDFYWAKVNCWDTYTAREKDYEKIARLACELWPHHSLAEMCDEIKEIIASENDMIFTLYCYEEMVGFAHCGVRKDYVEGTHSSPVGYLEGVYVKEEYRNLGFATELVTCCQNWAKSKGCKEFASDCEISNDASIKLHQSLGFGEAARLVHFSKKL